MTNDVLGAVIQVVLALIASGVAVKLLTLRQDRRKIAGEASTNEANAASMLSGAALQMVESAQQSARNAEARSTDAQRQADDARGDNEVLWDRLNEARWEIYYLKAREGVLEEALRRAGIEIPPAEVPRRFPSTPPPGSAPGPERPADPPGHP